MSAQNSPQPLNKRTRAPEVPPKGPSPEPDHPNVESNILLSILEIYGNIRLGWI